MSEVKLHVVPEIRGHKLGVVQEIDGVLGCYIFRWTCPCGGEGRFQAQSAEASVFKWFTHVWKAEGKSWPRDARPAYIWLEEERKTKEAQNN